MTTISVAPTNTRPDHISLPRRRDATTQLQPSPLRPNCSAKDRLTLWAPASASNTNHGPLSEEDRERVKAVLAQAWAGSTQETYGAGLSAFHAFCDKKGVPEDARAPASTDLMVSFVATLAGTYAGSTIRNYFSGVRAWHILHRVAWVLDKATMDTILKAADITTPETSKRSQRLPITVSDLLAIRQILDLGNSRDAAVWACATSLFYGIARTGELTVRTIKEYNPSIHPRRCNVSEQSDRRGNVVTAIYIPRTKTSIKGEEISFAQQRGLSDPVAALENHFRINAPNDSEHIFMHSTRRSSRSPLSRSIFLTRLKDVCQQAQQRGLIPNDNHFSGHSFRIGGTLEYLLREVSFEVVKSMGRWASDAFQIYLRKHAQILAPYLQDKEGFGEFSRLAMPSIRAGRR
ncbi:hypothetical protein BXZ70DRAFT_1001974 [Cristinia sonorae]|uniref:Tyr recombinase domain-containing protein n=1 Tax=Cristinia sonorae TaxID=1940300 RepID=A0A8K0UGX1_9AGAR|nr:hypothetical protein BXZ70DRAFT_1001974 [Cristinia sonorae]